MADDHFPIDYRTQQGEAIRSAGTPAVFLDRDGVVTELVLNPSTGEYESPRSIVELRLCPNVVSPLHQLQELGYSLFIVSNQPSYAKGKASLQSIKAVARAVEDALGERGVSFQETFYCYHHPEGIVPELTGSCACRKPEPHFLNLASERYGVDLTRSWMIGDRDSDILCGQRAGCRTVLVANPHSVQHQGASKPNHVAQDIAAAVMVIASEAGRTNDDHAGGF